MALYEGIVTNFLYDIAKQNLKDYLLNKEQIEKIIKNSALKSNIKNDNLIRQIERYIYEKGIKPDLFNIDFLSDSLKIKPETCRIFLKNLEEEILNIPTLSNRLLLEYTKDIKTTPNRYLLKYPYILYSPSYQKINDIFSNDLVYITKKENGFTHKIYSILFDKPRTNSVLISGDPTSGKTIFSFFLSHELSKQNINIYYCNIFTDISYDLLFDELQQKDELGTLIIFDNCHWNFGLVSRIFDRLINFKFTKFIFVTRNLNKENRRFEQLNNIDIFDLLEKFTFKLVFDDVKNIQEKVKGIVHKYKKYYNDKNQKSLIIGNWDRVLGNVHNNLLSLSYNLQFWSNAESLDRVNKKFVLKKIYDEYYDIRYENLILKVAIINQFEIPYESNQIEKNELIELTNKGILHYNSYEEYFYFYHPDFARLLVQAYYNKPKISKQNIDFDNFVIDYLKNYLVELKTYPLFLDSFYFNLLINHKLPYVKRLLNIPEIFTITIEYFKSQGSLEKLLFLLHRLKDKNFKLVQKIIKEIPNNVWLNKLNTFGIAGFAFSLICLRASNPELAKSLLLSISLDRITSKAERSNIALIANSLIEMNKISPRDKIGVKIYQSIHLDYLLSLINRANFIHIGKSLSELSKLDKNRTKLLLEKIPKNSIIEKAKKSNLKAITKSLNELNKIDFRLSNTISSYLSINLLKEKLTNTSFEGIGRSLNEYYNIDKYKTRRLFYSIPIHHWLSEAKNNTLLQLAHTLSELSPIDKNRVKKIFYLLDDDLLIFKTNDPDLSFSQICYALNQFKNIDDSGDKLRKLLSKIHLEHLVKKIKQADFHNIAIGLFYLNKVDKEFVFSLLKLLDKDIILKKSIQCTFKSFGESLLKINRVDKTIFQNIILNTNFKKKIYSGPMLKLDEIANSLNDLYKADYEIGRSIYSDLDIVFLLKSSLLTNKNGVKQAVTKFKKIDFDKTMELIKVLKINSVPV